MNLSDQIEKIAGKLSQDKEFYWINVGLDTNSKKLVSLGLKNEKSADKLTFMFENYSDITVFFVDKYGEDTEEYIKKTYKPLKIITNPVPNTQLVKKVYNLLK